MSSTTFALHIVSPAKLVFEGEASMVEVPGTEGDFGVLPGHAPFFSMIRPGIVTIHQGGVKEKHFISGGYADVGPDATTILSDDIRPLSGLSLEDALAALEQATDLSVNAESDTARAHAHKQREVAEALVLAIKAA
jgi:F-type H+-transporting ATPase subunit epsilon